MNSKISRPTSSTGVPVRNFRPLYGILTQLGQPLYGCLTPDGYKCTALSRGALCAKPISACGTSVPLIDERMTAERARQPGYVSLSFPTIAGFNANGALPHYRATPEAFSWISTPQGLVAEGLLLIDSGAQYLGGTTDITRVWAIGTPTAAQKRDFTLVLKGTMALSRTRFPLGTLAPMLDAIARGELDRLCIPENDLDVLAQQIVAECCARDFRYDDLFAAFRNAYPFRNLSRENFGAVVTMLAEGFSTRRGRRCRMASKSISASTLPL